MLLHSYSLLTMDTADPIHQILETAVNVQRTKFDEKRWVWDVNNKLDTARLRKSNIVEGVAKVKYLKEF